MRKIFIADAHLRNPGDANYRKLLAFLRELPAGTDTLYILGDLFEFWIGDPEPVYPHYREIVDCLKEVRGRGVRIVYFEGNHDFHLAGFFTRELQAEVYREGEVVDIGGNRVYLGHGDLINREDYRYRIFRGVLHSRAAGALVPLVSRRLTSKTAEYLSRRSSGKHEYRRHRWDYPKIMAGFARERFREGCDSVIIGHFHRPTLQREGTHTFIALGDWITQFSYAQWEDGIFTLERYQEG
ncbi:UDP-2,3-diacylglucosamine diphosphatase [Geomonas sp. Red32]|uniref:UDP-2,3-diacylglucosamine diphosphatase n=1 Tax=Geomonas sp. Red32 TaxID=2912856 RepID=UPI00202D0832|nr:UDP-2,3-diacylglucosamine diphosphatase [Geomonas sp. Red32]MCM0080110.1 UDP-2,3-diacylglucosamine diphosphatase [Geomonas sp. Red32]